MRNVHFPLGKTAIAAGVSAVVSTFFFLLAHYNVVGALDSSGSSASTPSSVPPAGATLTTLTPPSPPLPAGQQGPASAAPQKMPINPPQVANIPTTPCADTDLQASVTSFGIRAMHALQDIVTITSATPCVVNGYPSVALSDPSNSAQPMSVQVENGGTAGRSNPPGPVALGPGESASFVMEYPTSYSNSCPVATSMTVGVPGAAALVPVSLAPMNGDQTNWSICGDVSVSAFEQGNDPAQYIPSF